MPVVEFPRIRHATTTHQSGGTDAVRPEDITAAGQPTLRIVNETLTINANGILKSYTPTRTGQRWIPLFLRGVVSNNAGAGASLSMQFVATLTNSGQFGSDNSGVAGGSSQTLHWDWAASTASNLGDWQSTETPRNLFNTTPIGSADGTAWQQMDVSITNKGNNGSVAVAFLVLEY